MTHPLALGGSLHFAPSPLLAYKYPRASESVVRNIANGTRQPNA